MLIYLSLLNGEQQKSKFEQLYMEYRNLMFYVAKAILNDDSLAEDAVHQAFLNIVENLEKIEQVHALKTRGYVTVITRNVAINLYNRQKKQALIYFEEWDYDAEEGTAAPVQAMEQMELADIILSMPKQYGDILLLKYRYGYHDNEIAKLLAITPENARKRLERAKQRLNQLLKETEGTGV